MEYNEVREIQLCCIEILKTVDDICRKAGIEYSLCGGSVVGAHLYGGCLPWDDDIDLMMTRENYDQFIKLCRTELPDRYEVHHYKTIRDYHQPFTKIVDKTTTIVEGEMITGVFLDITVYDRVPKNFLKKLDYASAKLIVAIAHSPYRIDRTVKTSVIKFLRQLQYPCPWLLILCESILRINGHMKPYSYMELLGVSSRKVMPAEIFNQYIDIMFEGYYFRIVRNYVDYLICRYERTDFHEPKEKQIPPHYTCCDLSLPYREYRKKGLRT